MEPPSGVLSSLWNFLCFLPFFIGLLILGFIKGIIFCPLVGLIITIGNTAVILGLWFLHMFQTNYCILRSKWFGPVSKLILCLCVSVLVILWPVIGISGSVVGGVAYGFLQPMFATFQAVEGKTDTFFHCIFDGTLDTVRGSFNVVTDFKNTCYYSYLSCINELLQEPRAGRYDEIRLLYLPFAILAGLLGFLVDFPVISLLALIKSPYMLFKGWHRLFHDCIGREGPFLETICVPFAGLAILLWPLAVVGAVLGSMLSSVFLGAYAGVIVYQEFSLWSGLCYVVTSISIYDEYSNDTLAMPAGSCFPRPEYRKQKNELSKTDFRSCSRPNSFRDPPSRTASFKPPLIEVKPLELFDSLFGECQQRGETLVSKGLITLKDIEDAKSNKKGSRLICIGLPAYFILQTLLRSARANSDGILLNDNVTAITTANKTRDAFFDWFLNPLLILKDQIKAENLSEAEEEYFGMLVLLNGDHDRLQKLNIGSATESETKRAKLEAFARRIRGITEQISRFPTFRRRFADTVKSISENLTQEHGGSKLGNGAPSLTPRSKSGLTKLFSLKSFRSRRSNEESYQEAQPVIDREVEIA
ncbi:hypothetical protein NMG60_11006758 [Bertholletia excelsa]